MLYQANQPALQKPPRGTLVDWTRPLARGLAGLWLFNEQGGTLVADASILGTNGAWTGTLGSQWTSTKNGAAGLLNGTDNFVDLGAPLAKRLFTTATPFTLSVRAVLTANGSFPILLGFASASPVWELRYNGATRKPEFSNGAVALLAPTAVALNTLHSMTVTWDGANGRLYVDGLLVAGPTAQGFASATTRARIGARATSTGSLFFPGTILSAGAWTRALSAIEVAQLHAAPYSMARPFGAWFLPPPPPASFVPRNPQMVLGL